MINGEGIRDNSSEIASHDPSDAEYEASSTSPNSNYSSCDGSEFERYCSANSAMGTASLCSSLGNCNEFLDPDLGFQRNSWAGEDRSFENYDFRGRVGRSTENGGVLPYVVGFDRLSDGGDEFNGENGDAENRIGTGSKSVQNCDDNSSSLYGENNDGNSAVVRIGNGLNSSRISGSNSSLYRGICADNDNNGSSLPSSSNNSSSQKDIGLKRKDKCPYLPMVEQEQIENSAEQLYGESVTSLEELCSEHGVEVDGKEIGNVSEADDEASQRCELSEDDDSMLDYGTDEERIHLYERRNIQYFQKTKSENENALLMNSAVAFGSDDWDDFTQEIGENSLTPALLEKPFEQQHGQLETEKNLLATLDSNTMGHASGSVFEEAEQEETVRDIHVAISPVQVAVVSQEDIKIYPVRNILAEEKDAHTPISYKEIYSREYSDAARHHLNDSDDVPKREFQYICTAETIGMINNSSSTKIVKDSAATKDLSAECLVPNEVGKQDANEFYDEIVHDMEEILLDSGEYHGSRFTHGDQGSLLQQSHPFRDGSSTASTSGTDATNDSHPLVRCLVKIEWVEVVGAKQKKGDVSFGERLVGVKEYTVYRLRVWGGTDQWEVERRYRDFFALYRELKTFFTRHGWCLPSPWSSVERESRKIFGNVSPNVISERSSLIQDCLRSILDSGSPFSMPSSLIWFLSPDKAVCNSPMSTTLIPQSMQKLANGEKPISSYRGERFTEGLPTLGKTISLLVEISPHKPMKQLLEAQYYTCAGCHRHFDIGKTLLREFVQTLGWGKPRLCEYTGQLFCALCHTNETAVLPARVLHLWDFSVYPVSQLAKAYLESIYDQPMLCVSAVNPFLFSKVPTLLQIMGIRKKVGAMLPFVRCPFRRSLQRGLGSRKYLLESNDFFALRDLADLSKGAFAALPFMVETVARKILEHITQQCLVCCDVGIPCGAQQTCEDPSSFIFPFQEGEISRCSSCQSVFHKPCFRNISACPCGRPAEVAERVGPTERVRYTASDELDGIVDTPVTKPGSKSAVGFFSDLLSKAKQEKIWRPRNNNNPVILMGSLPSTSL